MITENRPTFRYNPRQGFSLVSIKRNFGYPFYNHSCHLISRNSKPPAHSTPSRNRHPSHSKFAKHRNSLLNPLACLTTKSVSRTPIPPYNRLTNEPIRSPVHTTTRNSPAVLLHASANHRTVSAAFVWHSSLRNGGSTSMVSNAPRSVTGSCVGVV